MKPNTHLFLPKPSPSGSRQFAEGIAVDVKPDTIAAKFGWSDHPLVEGSEVDVFYRVEGEFLRQRAAVLHIDDDGMGVNLTLKRIGPPASGNIRESERVSTVFEGILACMDADNDCPVIDVSDGGVALLAADRWEVGDRVRLVMRVNNGRYSGEAIVCSKTAARRGRFRYGLECCEDAENDNLKRFMPALSVALQVKHLEMMSW